MSKDKRDQPRTAAHAAKINVGRKPNFRECRIEDKNGNTDWERTKEVFPINKRDR